MTATTESNPRISGSFDPALSASRAKEYLKCPLQFRLHVVDRIKEPPTRATAAGTLVHSVLEKLFDVAQADRNEDTAMGLFDQEWAATKDSLDDVVAMFDDEAALDQWINETRDVVRGYFTLENPQRLEPVAREKRVDAYTHDGVRLRGFIDRIDRNPAGELRVVDYKTGKAPSPRFQDEALFQMRFYALLLKLTDRMPLRTQLVYIKAGQTLTFDPTADDIERFEDEVSGIWDRIERDAKRGEFAPRHNPLCNWCGVRAHCPLFDGVLPDAPADGIQRLLQTRVPASMQEPT